VPSTRLLLAGVGLAALVGCGQSQTDRQRDAFVAICANDGETHEFCACQGDTLAEALDIESFTAVVDLAAGMAQVEGDARNLIALGALSNPKLVAALGTVEEASASCRQAAAAKAAETESAAAEAERRRRAERIAARDCPHSPSLTPRAQDAPIDDVADLRPDMSLADIEAILECRGDVLNFDTATEWARKSLGIKTRQLLRAADGEPCPATARAGSDCDDGGWGFTPLRNVSQQFLVAFAGMPGAERAGIIWRRTAFPEGQYPTGSAIAQALAEKYGNPHLQANEEGYYSLGHRRGTVVHSWVHLPDGRPIPRGDSARRSRCVNGPRPTFQRGMSWNGACGLTVRAEVVPLAGNPALARELNVIVMNQQRFDAAIKQFDIDLKAAVEAQHRESGAKPDL
jgi:hypothetical protein